MSQSQDEHTPGDLEDRLNRLNVDAWKLHEKCMYRTSVRLSQEVRRTALAERKLLPLLRANFHLMNAARNTLEPHMGRDAAVENIAYLESPDRARAFQGDFDEAEYEHTVHWMSACSYDNLAVATAMEHGYNSEGMQACIADGIGVCRRTGKMECVTCFREYAIEVHRAADDVDMAMHFARANARRPEESAGTDRRYAGAKDEAALLYINGHLDAAWEAVKRAWSLVPTFHSPVHARRQTTSLMQELALLSGRADWLEAVPSVADDATPRGEDPLQDLRDDQNKALAASMTGDHAAAADLLVHWDKWLTDHQNLSYWMEVRLRLVANYLLRDQRPRAEALAKLLREKASAAKDYLTLRRLKLMLDGAVPVLPVPLAGPISGGAADSAAANTPAAAPANNSPPAVGAPLAQTAPTPLFGTVESVTQAVQAKLSAAAEAGSPPDLSTELGTLLSVTQAERFEDAASLMHLAGFVLAAGGAGGRETDVWAWAKQLWAAHPQSGPVLNALARIADVLRQIEVSPLAQEITPEEVGKLYRKSLELDPDQPNGFVRAGDFFLGEGDIGEAERCFARGFRLNRSNAHVARQLARLYNHTDRSTDALAVLDMCLREGGESPDLLWDAGMTAFGLGRHEAALTYFNRLDEVSPGGRWTSYYRAMSLLETNRPTEAMTAIDEQAAILDAYTPDPGEAPPSRLHVHCLRAAAAAAMDNLDAVRSHAEAALAVRLADIHDLSLTGIASNLRKLRGALQKLPESDPLRTQLDRRLLASGLMPDTFFDGRRQQNERKPELAHFIVTLQQPLGDDWSRNPARLPGQEDWSVVLIRYGVLATDEDEATRQVLDHHAGLFAQPAEVESIEPQSGPFHDHPGITWQAYTEEAGEDEDEEEDDEVAEEDEEEAD